MKKGIKVWLWRIAIIGALIAVWVLIFKMGASMVKAVEITESQAAMQLKVDRLFERVPYTEEIMVEFTPRDQMTYSDAMMEAVLGGKKIRINDSPDDTAFVAEGILMTFEEDLSHEYMHAIPQRPIREFEALVKRTGWTNDYAERIAEEVNQKYYYEEFLAESFKDYMFARWSLPKVTVKFFNDFMTGRLQDNRRIVDNLLGRRPDLQKIYGDDGYINAGYEMPEIPDVWSWYDIYGDEELALAVCGYRADLITFYEDGEVREEYEGQVPDTCLGWWNGWGGRREYAEFVTK